MKAVLWLGSLLLLLATGCFGDKEKIEPGIGAWEGKYIGEEYQWTVTDISSRKKKQIALTGFGMEPGTQVKLHTYRSSDKSFNSDFVELYNFHTCNKVRVKFSAKTGFLFKQARREMIISWQSEDGCTSGEEVGIKQYD